MNAVSSEMLARIAEQDIEDRLKSRAARLEYFMHGIKQLARTNGRFTPQESLDLLCCVAECMGDDIREVAKAIKEDIACDLEGIIHPGDRDD